jgi:hypothetical protein
MKDFVNILRWKQMVDDFDKHIWNIIFSLFLNLSCVHDFRLNYLSSCVGLWYWWKSLIVIGCVGWGWDIHLGYTPNYLKINGYPHAKICGKKGEIFFQKVLILRIFWNALKKYNLNKKLNLTDFILKPNCSITTN